MVSTNALFPLTFSAPSDLSLVSFSPVFPKSSLLEVTTRLFESRFTPKFSLRGGSILCALGTDGRYYTISEGLVRWISKAGKLANKESQTFPSPSQSFLPSNLPATPPIPQSIPSPSPSLSSREAPPRIEQASSSIVQATPPLAPTPIIRRDSPVIRRAAPIIPQSVPLILPAHSSTLNYSELFKTYLLNEEANLLHIKTLDELLYESYLLMGMKLKYRVWEEDKVVRVCQVSCMGRPIAEARSKSYKCAKMLAHMKAIGRLDEGFLSKWVEKHKTSLHGLL